LILEKNRKEKKEKNPASATATTRFARCLVTLFIQVIQYKLGTS
jgi:hypothetical protein